MPQSSAGVIDHVSAPPNALDHLLDGALQLLTVPPDLLDHNLVALFVYVPCLVSVFEAQKETQQITFLIFLTHSRGSKKKTTLLSHLKYQNYLTNH